MTGWPILPSKPEAPPRFVNPGEEKSANQGHVPLKAGNYGIRNARLKRRTSRSTFYRILHRIADLVKPKLRRVFIESVEAVQDAIPMDEVEKVLRGPNPLAALELIRSRSSTGSSSPAAGSSRPAPSDRARLPQNLCRSARRPDRVRSQ